MRTRRPWTASDTLGSESPDCPPPSWTRTAADSRLTLVLASAVVVSVVFWHHRTLHCAGHNYQRNIRQAVLYDYMKRDEFLDDGPPPADSQPPISACRIARPPSALLLLTAGGGVVRSVAGLERGAALDRRG